MDMSLRGRVGVGGLKYTLASLMYIAGQQEGVEPHDLVTPELGRNKVSHEKWIIFIIIFRVENASQIMLTS